MRGAAWEESAAGICRVAGVMPYMGLMTAERTARLLACSMPKLLCGKAVLLQDDTSLAESKECQTL